MIRLIIVRPQPLILGVVAVLAASLLIGCGEGSDGSTAPSPTSVTSVPPTEALPGTPPTLPSPEPIRPGDPSLSPQPSGEVVVTGEVFAGVEPGCTLLRTDTGDYLVFGPVAEQLRVGSTVTVRGQVRSDLLTTCMQGTPLEVQEVLD